MRVRLEILDGLPEDKGKVFEVVQDGPQDIAVGRSSRHARDGEKNAYLQVSSEDSRLSRRHFMLMIRPPDCYVCDLGSTNHTYVDESDSRKSLNGRVALRDGSVIRVGGTCLKVHLDVEVCRQMAKHNWIGTETKELARKPQEAERKSDFSGTECRFRGLRPLSDWKYVLFRRGEHRDGNRQPNTHRRKNMWSFNSKKVNNEVAPYHRDRNSMAGERPGFPVVSPPPDYSARRFRKEAERCEAAERWAHNLRKCLDEVVELRCDEEVAAPKLRVRVQQAHNALLKEQVRLMKEEHELHKELAAFKLRELLCRLAQLGVGKEQLVEALKDYPSNRAMDHMLADLAKDLRGPETLM